MRRCSAVLVLVFLTIPLAALAQSVEEVAEEVAFRGYYVDDGVEISINAMEELAEQYPGIGFVALDEDPEEGADLFADDVLATIDDPDTIIVLSASEVGAVSDGAYSQEEMDDALDEAFATAGDSYLTDFTQIAFALTGVQAPDVVVPATQDSSEGGGNGLLWLLLIVVAFAAFIWFATRRGKRKRAEAAAIQLEAAKSEIREQMSVIANEILEFSDRVDQDEHPDAVEHFRKASDVFKAAEDRMDAASTAAELESLSDDLDVARWEMAAADAIVEGREVPPKPEQEKPVPCFFDPTHGAGVEEATLQTSAGARTVMVCRQDAERLRRGEKPEPRSIDVGGRRVPAPQAPRSSGGGGMDWLDAFSILVGGMSRGTDYSWGRRPSPRRTSGGLGGLFGGSSSQSSGIPRPPRRSSSGSSRRSTSSSSRSRSSSRRTSRSTSRGRRGR